jgi:hypothetical protein
VVAVGGGDRGHRAMKILYVNGDDKSDPLNGSVMTSADKLVQLLDERRNTDPLHADLVGDNGFELMIEIAGDITSAQYSRSDGVPPYLMAISPHPPPVKAGYVEFLSGGTPTLKQVACHFLDTGERSDAVSWLEFDPGAAREDAFRASQSRKRIE